jgi:hypothetical protein
VDLPYPLDKLIINYNSGSLNILSAPGKKGKKGTECETERDRIGPRRDASLGPSILPWEAETPKGKECDTERGRKGHDFLKLNRKLRLMHLL